MSSGTSGDTTTLTGERADLLAELAHARHFLRFTARDLDDDQARQRPTVSALSIGGLIKHLTACERNWAKFIVHGPAPAQDFTNLSAADYAAWNDGFRLLPGETLAGVLAEYAEAAAEVDELVATVPDLEVSHPLPPAPWNEPGARWTVRRTLLHIISETSQHAGHADIIRESIDGAKSMG
jgi:uncharacterized damage-inducible protein DinB